MSRLAALVLAALTGMGCRSEASRPRVQEPASSEPLLEGVKRVAVEGHSEVPAFGVASRAAQMEKLPCTRCHTVPVAQMKPVKPAAQQPAEQKNQPAARRRAR